ncbi:MAG: hypothetical protein IPL43_15110 [Micropruina sp.]|nr:hypothetical protein [Micropruina sp.]
MTELPDVVGAVLVQVQEDLQRHCLGDSGIHHRVHPRVTQGVPEHPGNPVRMQPTHHREGMAG